MEQNSAEWFRESLFCGTCPVSFLPIILITKFEAGEKTKTKTKQTKNFPQLWSVLSFLQQGSCAEDNPDMPPPVIAVSGTSNTDITSVFLPFSLCHTTLSSEDQKALVEYRAKCNCDVWEIEQNLLTLDS